VHGEETAEEKTRSFPIDATGKQVVRLEVEGPPTARFRVELGGTALAGAAPKAAPEAGRLSRSIFTPTTIGADGVVSGSLPGGDRRTTYYLALDVKKGDLLSQISVQSRAGANKSLDFALLDDDAPRRRPTGYTARERARRTRAASRSIATAGASCDWSSPVPRRPPSRWSSAARP
jgi:hypothetical protein